MPEMAAIAWDVDLFHMMGGGESATLKRLRTEWTIDKSKFHKLNISSLTHTVISETLNLYLWMNFHCQWWTILTLSFSSIFASAIYSYFVKELLNDYWNSCKESFCNT